jgi:hypothetical protein
VVIEGRKDPERAALGPQNLVVGDQDSVIANVIENPSVCAVYGVFQPKGHHLFQKLVFVELAQGPEILHGSIT